MFNIPLQMQYTVGYHLLLNVIIRLQSVSISNHYLVSKIIHVLIHRVILSVLVKCDEIGLICIKSGQSMFKKHIKFFLRRQYLS